MKTSIFFLSVFFILASCSEGKSQNVKDSLTFNKVIADYIDGIKNTNFKKIKSVFSNDAIVKIPRSGKVIVETKNDILDDMKRYDGIKQNFNYTCSTVCYCDEIAIAKIKFAYPLFNLYEYLVVEKQDERWKITQVIKEYNDTTDKNSIRLAAGN
jgi:hypothetical protein